MTNERIKDGVTEHRHGEYDFWHPASRVHSTAALTRNRGTFDSTRDTWDVEDDDIWEILEAMMPLQTHFDDEFGNTQPIETPLKHLLDMEPMTQEWAVAISNLPQIEAQITYTSGRIRKVRVSSYHNGVEFSHGRVCYDPDTPLLDAKLLIECGLAAKYIPQPNLSDALHLLHVVGDERYYDLVRLPSGGHIPVEILEDEYEVSWETIAKIPIGEPRNGETFACPICGEGSFYSGVCRDCVASAGGADGYDETLLRRIQEVQQDTCTRKEREHGEILRLIKSGAWKNCRYSAED